MKPIIKWAGGKRQLLEEIKKNIPISYGTYFEPFVGGGAVYFELQPQKAVINDLNEQLINLYNVVASNKEELIKELDILSAEHSETNYYKIRDAYNECLNKNELSIKSASYFIYLNKTGFNGLYRVNRDGLFNVPSAHKKKANLYDLENINQVSNLLKKTKIKQGDFEKAVKYAKKGDFVFFDSPYYSTFDTYQPNGFSEEQHIRLANLFHKLTEKGVYCMLTNSNEDFIKELYKDMNIKVVPVKRMINCDASRRTGEEVIITNY